ncbi:short chain dehydrogenase/reductase-like protein [Mollisia scopiformis]|uniref:Short chain dehydrogenase/reductase-like protein n=1 Tax=Mollisia scopiformis TaxID=149040 RepID=A0A194X0B9_MOLSC|nr:short chain dehydrogenase/reductase-like protein [Mollisia scopiformis]KUJ13640.1 short chain dehydrogenase/reductase-like protein [Mollisia scopiformis]
MAKDHNNVVEMVRQSPPVDTTEPYDPAWVAGKTIIITGGASGFGAGFAKKWALNGANVFVADVNREKGKELVEEMRKESGSEHHHFVYCDVTNWQSQVDLFRTAIKLSPHGGIDAVVANAGITDVGSTVDDPKGLDVKEPPEPVFKTIDVNIIGVLYTTHLAMFWLPRNDKSTKPSPSKLPPGPYTRDRHILLIGSIASLCPIPHQIQYGTSKHAVLGLFRSLRSSSFIHGVRVNLLCPYFIDTPIIPAAGRLLLAGGAMGKPEDVVDAGTRLMADSRIAGRALAIGPKVMIDDEWQLVPQNTKGGKEVAVWEAYADDFVEVDAFTRRFVGMLNSVERTRGWIGWAIDVAKAALYPLGLLK